MSCHDHEIVKSIQFNAASDKLFSITQKGLFCVWDVATLKRIYYRNFEKNTQSMIVFRKSDKIIICLEKEVNFIINLISQNQNC